MAAPFKGEKAYKGERVKRWKDGCATSLVNSL